MNKTAGHCGLTRRFLRRNRRFLRFCQICAVAVFKAIFSDFGSKMIIYMSRGLIVAERCQKTPNPAFFTAIFEKNEAYFCLIFALSFCSVLVRYFVRFLFGFGFRACLPLTASRTRSEYTNCRLGSCSGCRSREAAPSRCR